MIMGGWDQFLAEKFTTQMPAQCRKNNILGRFKGTQTLDILEIFVPKSRLRIWFQQKNGKNFSCLCTGTLLPQDPVAHTVYLDLWSGFSEIHFLGVYFVL
jgi:hypothetical protein